MSFRATVSLRTSIHSSGSFSIASLSLDQIVLTFLVAQIKRQGSDIMMEKPYKGVLRRSFNHGVACKLTRSEHQTKLHASVNKVQVRASGSGMTEIEAFAQGRQCGTHERSGHLSEFRPAPALL